MQHLKRLQSVRVEVVQQKKSIKENTTTFSLTDWGVAALQHVCSPNAAVVVFCPLGLLIPKKDRTITFSEKNKTATGSQVGRGGQSC